ncbi:MAG: hypothetical protein IKU41_00780 [Clostridia bacterium]|nr:hypothetical protein [Clostridia bacterium]
MDAKKLIKTAIKVAPLVSVTVGIFSLALSKYQEKQGDYSREFPEIENELKFVIDEVRNNGK